MMRQAANYASRDTLEKVTEKNKYDLFRMIYIAVEQLPPELKQVALQIVQNQIDRDTAEKKLADLIQRLEFDITVAELSAYLFKPGHA